MPKLFVEKSVEIKASAQAVWQVLTDPEFTKEWIKEFSPGFVLLDSDWKMDSPVLWKDANGKTEVWGKVTAVVPYTQLRFSVMPANEAPTWEIKPEDGITYTLEEKNGKTHLSVSQGDFGLMPEHEKYYLMTAIVWDKVLPQLKALVENNFATNKNS